MWRITINTFNKIWNIVLYAIVAIEIVLLILFALPSLFGAKAFVVSSGSMIPKFEVGSIVYTRIVDPEDIKIGDSITFYMADTDAIATHEVYEISEDGKVFRTQGINNKDENGNLIHDAEPTPYQRVIGKVVFSIPAIGVIYGFITNIPVLCTIAVLTIIMILVSFFMGKRKEENVELK